MTTSSLSTPHRAHLRLRLRPLGRAALESANRHHVHGRLGGRRARIASSPRVGLTVTIFGDKEGFMTKVIRVLLLCLLILGNGCATGKPMAWVEQGVSLSRYRQLDVASVSNDTGREYDFDVTGTLTEKIKSKLTDKGYLAQGAGTGREGALVLKPHLTAYEPGNAAKRWLAPGHGATHCTVRVSLIDQESGKQVGEIIVAKAISEGGLFSIGADRSILDAVASDIAETLDDKMKSAQP